MSYLGQYDQLEGQPQQQVALVSRWIRTEPRGFFAELRADRPILATPAFTLFARSDDVIEVLSREQEFSVRLNAAKMDPVVGGPFMLARDGSPVNWREKGIMQAVLRPEDLPRVRAMAGEVADEALDAAQPQGRIETVSELGRYVPVRMCGAYFGFPGPDLDAMYRWSKATQTDMFKNLSNDPAIHQAAVEAGQEMRSYLVQLLSQKREALVAEPTGVEVVDAVTGLVLGIKVHLAGLLNRTGAPVPPGLQTHIVNSVGAVLWRVLHSDRGEPQDVFSRLLRAYFPRELGFDDQRILANVAGLLIGSVETTSQAIVQVLRQLLVRDTVREAAIAAAADPDTTRFDAYVWEALRLDPINPLLFRFTERDSVVAAGTTREARIKKGTILFALTASAMSDEALVADPHEFRVDRSGVRELHFGFGHHTCLGQYVGAEVIPEVVRRVLLRPGVRLLPSPEGDLDFQGGPFPERFVIGFGSPAHDPGAATVHPAEGSAPVKTGDAADYVPAGMVT
jgi:cytochrome P450